MLDDGTILLGQFYFLSKLCIHLLPIYTNYDFVCCYSPLELLPRYLKVKVGAYGKGGGG